MMQQITVSVLFMLIASTECVSKQPNIVFLLADDLGWNDVGFHGSQQVKTPFLDSLANSGLILNNYYTASMCTPSRASLMTGRYPFRVGLQNFVIDSGQRKAIPLQFKLLPEYLNKLGYESHMMGKWHLGAFHKNYTPTYRGFDTFYGYYYGSNDYYDHQRLVYTDDGSHQLWWGLDWHFDVNLKLSNDYSDFGKYSAHAITDRACDLIENHDFDSKPLFMYVAFQNVHSASFMDPMQVPKESEDLFPNIWHKLRRKYVGMVYELDLAIETIFKSLESKGILDNTIIIFSSDNGGSVDGYGNTYGDNFPLRASKAYYYEGGVRASAFIWGNLFKQRSGQIAENLMHITDWLPTLVDLAGGNSAEISANIDGLSMSKILTNKNAPSPRDELPLNINSMTNLKAMRYKNFKYLLNPNDFEADTYDNWFQAPGINPDVNETMTPDFKPAQIWCGDIPSGTDFSCYSAITGLNECLFDIENDPCEYYNLVDNPEYLDVKQMLLEKLEKWEKIALPPQNPPFDQAGDPKLQGYIWQPWTDDPNLPNYACSRNEHQV